MRKLIFSLFLVLPAVLAADFSVELKTGGRRVPVEAQLRDGRIMVDLVQVAEGLGGKTSIKDGEYVLDFSSGTTALNPENGIYRFRAQGEAKWKGAGLTTLPYYSGPRLFIAMEDLPLLTFRTYGYHLQKKELTDTGLPTAASNRTSDKRPVKARHAATGNKDWVSLEDVSRALGVVLYNSRPRRYGLIMPDLTALEVSEQDPWIYRKGERYKSLQDPILLISGVPYATVDTLSTLFEAEMAWDKASGALLVPAGYGTYKEVEAAAPPLFVVNGYRPEAFNFSVDEMSTFVQKPGPTYAADHPDIYESVRDFVTNLPIDPRTRGGDLVSGAAVLNLKGSSFSQPLQGGARFEKVGTRARLANGDLQWGFPRFQVRAGRQYVSMAGFYNQFDLVDHVEVSHSNDPYGDGDQRFTWKARALYGQNLFTVFVSTEFFSQVVDYRQNIGGGSLEGTWNLGARQTLSSALSLYRFDNRVRQISTDFNFFSDLFGEGFVLDVDPVTAKVVASSVLTDRHDTAVWDTQYKVSGLGQAGLTGGLSGFKDPATGKSVRGDDWQASATLGDKGSRLTTSYERSSPDYRSIGSPLRYQDRRITRLAPYLDLAKPWKMYGEFRREDYLARGQTTQAPYRSDFAYLANALNFRTFSVRALVNAADYSLYGKRWSAALDGSRYFGRDSLDLGAVWASQWFDTGFLFKQSYTGRVGWQFLRPDRKFSIGEDLTRHHYPFYKLEAWKGIFPQFPNQWESTTRLLGQWKVWEGSLQYNFKPRSYRESETLYTGYLRLGYQVNQRKVFNVFYAATSLSGGLSSPQVWRAGLEYVNDFY